MSILDTIGSLFGKGGGSSASLPEALIAAIGSQEGGLNGLIQKFEASGLGGVAASWIGTGQNQGISPEALQGVLGSGFVQQIAAKTGLPVQQLLPQIAEHLPKVVDGLTPNGQVPSGQGLLDAGLAFLKNRASPAGGTPPASSA